jgi:hypothetical protein
MGVGLAAGDPVVQEVSPPVAVEGDPAEVGPGALALFAGVGRLDYEETVSLEPVRSDWNATVLTVGGRWLYVNPAGYKLRVISSVWRTGDDTETWADDSGLRQRNDLAVRGFDGAGDFGLDLRPPGASGQTLFTLWGGLGYRWQEFERSSFFTPNETSGLENVTVDESYDIAYGRLALEASGPLSERWSWSGEILGGAVFYNKADNALLGSIEGDGGFMAAAGAHVWHQPRARHRVGAGIRYDLQDLDGGDRTRFFTLEDGRVVPEVVEWPDNELSRILVDLQWMVEL